MLSGSRVGPVGVAPVEVAPIDLYTKQWQTTTFEIDAIEKV